MVIRELHEAGPLSVTSAKMTVICQLHETGWRLSVSYMRQDGGYLSVMYLTDIRHPASCS
jgi:acetoacetate decarboxylase